MTAAAFNTAFADASSVAIVKPTLGRLLRIWIVISARALALSLIAAIGAAILIAVGIVVAGGGEAEIAGASRLAGPLIAIPVSLYSIFRQLGRKCGDVRLVLVRA